MSNRAFSVIQFTILVSLVNSRVMDTTDLLDLVPTTNITKFEDREHGHDKHAKVLELDIDESHNKVEHYIMSEKRKRSNNNFNFKNLRSTLLFLCSFGCILQGSFLKLKLFVGHLRFL